MKIWKTSIRRYVETITTEAGRLVAILATHDDARRRVDWAIDSFSAGLVSELENRQVRQRVIADMLGVSVRTFQRKYTSKNLTINASLWSRILTTIAHEPQTEIQLSARFTNTDSLLLASMLQEMLSTGWLTKDVETLHAKIETTHTDAQIQAFVNAAIMINPNISIDVIATELNIDIDEIERFVPSGHILHAADDRTRWLASTAFAERVFWLLETSALAKNNEAHQAYISAIHIDEKNDEVMTQVNEIFETAHKTLDQVNGFRSEIVGGTNNISFNVGIFRIMKPLDSEPKNSKG